MQGKNKNDKFLEIDVTGVWRALFSKLWIICVSSVLCAVIALLSTVYLITPKYQSSAMFYVNNNSLSVGEFSLSSADITAAKSLVDTYIVILNSRSCLNDVIDYAEVDYSYAEIKDMIDASAVNATEIFEVKVTSPDPVEAKEIANAIARILPKRISSIVEGTAANIVDYAVKPSAPYSPSYTKNTLLGFLIGLLTTVAIIVVRVIFDTTIRDEEDVQRCTSYPVLTAVPNMLNQSKGGYYAYGSSNFKKKKHTTSQQKSNIIGKNINFAASEAYKLLRTKLQFSFVDGVKCPVIGVSSALAGEGKSVSSVNIAYSLSQLNKRVLLIDCDMRRPSLESKLHIRKIPGLSNYLTGQNGIEEVIQRCEIEQGERFDVIAAGINPPNPIELLSSSTMEKALTSLRDIYDYIIIDLPPVGEVSDAMVAAKLADGILLVVRQDYCNTTALAAAVNQFEFIEARILGVVINYVDLSSGKYGKKYYKKYYSSYECSYAYDNDNHSKNR